jgi:hypothetical protein
MIGAEHAFVAVTDWLGPAPPALERPEALARLARRYLAGHGPADARDLAKWAKLPLGDARAAFTAIGDDVMERPDGFLDVARHKTVAPLPAPRLLGPFDPLLLGWAERDAFVGTSAHGIVTTNGLFRPFALVDGRVVAVWSLRGHRLTLHPLERVARAALDALRADAADVFRYLDLPADGEIVVER